ncbi:ABC transporter ATP-binding protein [Salinigranum halophilum]|uniref:ABC transporter ATP-binding protein n=1 Tax=Salinigranum halophilum TaxID=2565931 RepID=UPI001F2B41DF|nr:ABC transporter ATP-binding protein [Salinigranum halophilum]
MTTSSTTSSETPEVGYREKLTALYEAASYRPTLGLTMVALGLATAVLEGVGLGFLLPIIEFTQSRSPSESPSQILSWFVQIYEFLGIPFELGYLIAGVAVVMSVRFGLSFVAGWQRAKLNMGYRRFLRRRLYNGVMYAPIGYLDQAGSDDLLNSFITEATRAGSIVNAVFRLVGSAIRGAIYLGLAMFLSPILTLVALVGIGVSTLLVRFILEPAYGTGDDIADVNQRIQSIAQAGIQGMRDVRLFTLRDEYDRRMDEALDQFVNTNVKFRINQSAMGNFNQLTNALVVFALIYTGLEFTGLSLGEIGVFLFAVFRLSPVVSRINNILYGIDGELPHLVRVQSRLDELEELRQQSQVGDEPVSSVDHVAFEDVSFAYERGEPVLQDISFDVSRGEKVAFVGQSGAGKSTITALLARLQDPDSGQITADGVPIEQFDVEQWRERIAVVRQNPFIFNDTLWENLTVGNREASRAEVERVCEIAQVTEFFTELSDGYETELGDDGVRLSGGQKQRVAIARALLKDADLLILDEATSDLDSNIEQAVYEAVREREAGYATISIAHRLSTVDDADRIYTLVNGSVAEAGTHQELLDNNGLYAELHATQA